MVFGMTCLAAITRMAAGRNWDLIQALLDWLPLDGPSVWIALSVGFGPVNRSKNGAHGNNYRQQHKRGSKRHLVCDGQGTALAIELTGANCHDSTQALPVLDALPLLQGPSWSPRCRPDSLLGDRASMPAAFGVPCVGAESCLESQCAIRNMVAGRGDGAGSSNVPYLWLNQFPHLPVRYEKRTDIPH